MQNIAPHLLLSLALLVGPAAAQSTRMTVPLLDSGNAPAAAGTARTDSAQPQTTQPEDTPVVNPNLEVSSTPAETGAPAPAERDPDTLEPAQTEMPDSTKEALATPTVNDPDASAANAPGVNIDGQQLAPQTPTTAASSNPSLRDTTVAGSDAAADQAGQDAAATAQAQAAAARQYASTVQAKSQVGMSLTPEDVAAIASAPAITPVFLFDQDEGQGDPASPQSTEDAGANRPAQAAAGQDAAESDSVATAATEPEQDKADGTAPGNEGSTGWTGGLGGSMIGTNPAGALPESKTWQPPTARGLDLTG